MKSKPTKESFRAWNDEMILKYDPEAIYDSSNFLIRLIENRRVEMILQTLEAGPSDRILEVGCGAGNILEQVGCGHLFGTDISSLMLKKTAGRLGSRSNIFSGDAGDLPVKKESFNKVICTEVIEHVLDPGRILKEIHRILCDEGRFVLSIPNDRLIYRVKRPFFPLVRWWNRFHPGEYQMLEQEKFEWHLHEFDIKGIEDFFYPYFRPSVIHGIPYRFLPFRYVIQCLKV